MGLKSLNLRFASLLGLIAPMIGVAGISMFFWVVVAFSMTAGLFDPQILGILAAGPLDAVLAVVAYRKRGSFLVMSRMKQRALVLCSWTVHVVGLVVWFRYFL